GFAVARDGDRLLIRRGILQRRVAAVPLRRVHAATVIEGPLRQPLGLCSVRLETAGYGREPAAARTLFPLLRIAEVDARLAELVPALAGGLDRLERPPIRALRRYALRGTLASIAAGIALTVLWPSAWPAIPLLAALGALDGALRYRNAGWLLSGERLALRRGALLRRTLIARADRLQDESVAQSPLQRRARLASLGVTVASGAVAHLESSTAAALLGRLRPARPARPAPPAA
ncbi:MAG: PH domain-containing protein, partial [Thermoleophilaceae bacterium]